MNPLDIITGISPIISKVLDLIPDPNARARAEAETQAKLMEYAAQQANAQAEINTAEASNPSVFVAGWRPFIGWVCGTAFAFVYVVAPTAAWIAGMFGKTVPLPNYDMNALMSLTLGMLGLGAMRSFDKMKGTSK